MMNKDNRNFFKRLTKTQRLLLLVGIPLITFSILPIIIILLIGLIPSITVLVTDSKNSQKLVIVGCFNLAGVFVYIFNILSNYSVYNAFHVFTIFNLIVMLGSASLGVIAYNELPKLFVLMSKASVQKRLKDIDNRLNKIRDEWGDAAIEEEDPAKSKKKPSKTKPTPAVKPQT